MSDLADRTNSAVWRNPYAQGNNNLRYSNDFLVRPGFRMVSRERDRRMLDFGFGISQVEVEPLGTDMYRSEVPGQEGCILTIPDREGLTALFPGRQSEFGEFGFQFAGKTSRHWVVTYRMHAA